MDKLWKRHGLDGRAWLECTKWTGKDAIALTRKTIKTLKFFGYDVRMSKTDYTGFGKTIIDDDKSIKYSVGVREIIEKPNERFNLRKALAPTVACFHEVFGHGGQWRNETQKNTPLSKVLLLNDLACRNSNNYYGAYPKTGDVMPHYFEQPHEIAAQYMGLKMCQQFLSAIYGPEKANDLLCEHVNLRIIGHSEFITYPDSFEPELQPYGHAPYVKPTEPFQDMDDAYNHFQQTFVKQVFGHVDYTVPKHSDDFAATYINEQKWPWERPFVRKQINNIEDRLTLTYTLSALWLEQSPKWAWVKGMPVFADINFPNDVASLIRGAPEPPKEKDLNLETLDLERLDVRDALKRLEQEYAEETQQI